MFFPNSLSQGIGSLKDCFNLYASPRPFLSSEKTTGRLGLYIYIDMYFWVDIQIPTTYTHTYYLKNKCGGGFKDFLFSPLFGEDSEFWLYNILQRGWFNHQPDIYIYYIYVYIYISGDEKGLLTHWVWNLPLDLLARQALQNLAERLRNEHHGVSTAKQRSTVRSRMWSRWTPNIKPTSILMFKCYLCSDMDKWLIDNSHPSNINRSELTSFTTPLL